jgi:uncharacterized membrane protein YphA (DoxX/SURF4 family)
VALLSRDVWDAPEWAATADALRIAPSGLGWMTAHVPLGQPFVQAILAIFVITGALALVGCLTRASSAVAVVALAYLLAVPHFAGAGFHSHHLLWLGLLVAASPSADALSVDAWRARRRGAAESLVAGLTIRHGLPLRCAWLVLGLVFLFPGLWKWSVGPRWALGEALRGQLYWKWAEHGDFRPWPRVDLWPGVLEAGGLAVMSLEVLAIVGLLLPRWRPWTVAALLVFHAATAWLFLIHFPTLWLCYLAFVPWAVWSDRLHRRAAPPTLHEPRVAWAPTAIVGGALIVGIAVAGGLGVQQGFPFACYPTFHHAPPRWIPSLELEVDEGGRRGVVDLSRNATQREWALQWALALRPDPLRIAAWVDVLRSERAELVGGADEVRVFRVLLAADPRDRHGEVGSRELLWPAQNGPAPERP